MIVVISSAVAVSLMNGFTEPHAPSLRSRSLPTIALIRLTPIFFAPLGR